MLANRVGQQAAPPKADGYVFVLCDDWFDEVTVAVFVSELREAGVRVKVVGVHGRRMTSAYGLRMDADMTLGQALPLAYNTIGVIIPGSQTHWRSFETDPRIQDLLTQAQANGALFVIPKLGQPENGALDIWETLSADQVVVCPEREKRQMIRTARDLASRLSR